MTLTKLTTDLSIIAALGTTPQERALTTDQFKAKFDEAAVDIQTYINDTMTVEIDDLVSTMYYVNVKSLPAPYVSAVGDGVTDDTVALQSAINLVQSYGSAAHFLSDGTNDTQFGGTVTIPHGKYKITSELTIVPITAQGDGDETISYAGVNIIGDGLNNTIIDATEIISGNGITISGSHVNIKDLQILNSPGHGISLTGWRFNIERVFINKAVTDGIYFGRAFLVNVSKCIVYDVGGYGFSFNDYHTSCKVSNNYALHTTLGGFFAGGNRANMSLSKGMVYSEFDSNACDVAAIGYTFALPKGVSVNGCGCEQTTNAIYVYGTNSNISINGFFAHQTTSNTLSLSGNSSKIKISNLYDSDPTDISIPLIAGGGSNAQLTMDGIYTTRSYISGVEFLMNILNKKIKKSTAFATNSATIATLKHPTGYNAHYGGKIIVRAANGGLLPTSNYNTATYDILIDKGAGGSTISTIGYVGLKGDTTASGTWPSFNFTISGDSLIATHTNTGAWTSKSFTFEFDTTGNIDLT